MGSTFTLTVATTERQQGAGLMMEHLRHCEKCLRTLKYDVSVEEKKQKERATRATKRGKTTVKRGRKNASATRNDRGLV